MKKILSLVLAVSMLIGLVYAIPASAAETVTITDKEVVTLEFEDYYADFKGADGSSVGGEGWVVSAAMLSGGKAIRTGSGPMQDVSLTIPLRVENAGTYDIETAVSYAGHLSLLTLYLDDSEVKVLDGSGTALSHAEGSYYFGSKDYNGYKYNFQLELSEGDHNLKLHVKQRAPQFNGGDTAFAADYITLKSTAIGKDAISISGLDVTKLEVEDFATDFKGADDATIDGSGWIMTGSMLSGEKAVRTGSGPKQDVFLSLPLNVKIGGTFEVEMAVTCASWLSTLSLLLDDTEVKVFDTNSGTALLHSEEEGYYFGSKDFPGYKYVFDLPISSGEHELKLRIKQRAEQFNGGDTAFAADYIILKSKTAMSSAEISKAGTTRMEAESYIGNILSGGVGYADAAVTENAKASGGKVLGITEAAIPDASILVPINVKDAGVYDINTVMARSADNWTSYMTMSLDGTKLLDNRSYHREDLSDLESETPFMDSSYPMHNFPTRVYLEEGVHTIEFNAAPAVQDNKVKFMIDCLSVSPAEALAVENGTNIEFEDYIDQVNCMWKPIHGNTESAPNLASGGDYAYSYGAGTDDASLYLPLSVSEPGLYDIEYVVAHASHLSRIDMYLDDAEYPFQSNSHGGVALDTDEAGYFHSPTNLPAKKYQFSLYLSEGDHALRFHIPTRPAGDIMSVAYAADYMRFTKQDAVAVDAENGATIEMENYVDDIFADGNVMKSGTPYADMNYTATVGETDIIKENASGGAILNMSERTNLEHATIYVPVTAEEDGWYHVDWTVTNAGNGAHLSHTTLYLDGEKLVTNDGESIAEDVSVYAEGMEGDPASILYPSKWYPMGRYEAQVQLTAGEHVFTIDAERIKNFTDGNYGVKFHSDAIKLTPIKGVLGSDSSFVESIDHTGADWSFDMIAAGVSGTAYAYIASYNGNQLIDAAIEPLKYVSGENTFSGSVPAISGVNKMKFFAWDENHTPLAKEKELTFMPINDNPFEGDNEINVVFIGDSIYEGAGASSVDTRWVSRVGKWFEDTYEKDGVTVNWYNEGVGGSTTDYSLVRMFRDVLDHDPDVIFYSCSCNDVGDTRRNMESFLLTVMAQDKVPYVIFNRTTNRSFSTTNGRGDQIAAHYNIPFVDDYYAFKRAVAESGKKIDDYFTNDGVHPNDLGYKVIADEMIACVSSGRYYHKPVSDGTKIIENSVAIENATFLSSTSADVVKTGSWTSGNIGQERAYVHSTQVGDTLEFTFTGNMLAFEHGLHDPAGKYEVYVDGNLAMTCNPQYNGITSYFHFVCKADTVNLDLPDGTHNVLVKTVPGDKTTDDTYAVRIFNIITGNVKR